MARLLMHRHPCAPLSQRLPRGDEQRTLRVAWDVPALPSLRARRDGWSRSARFAVSRACLVANAGGGRDGPAGKWDRVPRLVGIPRRGILTAAGWSTAPCSCGLALRAGDPGVNVAKAQRSRDRHPVATVDDVVAVPLTA